MLQITKRFKKPLWKNNWYLLSQFKTSYVFFTSCLIQGTASIIGHLSNNKEVHLKILAAFWESFATLESLIVSLDIRHSFLHFTHLQSVPSTVYLLFQFKLQDFSTPNSSPTLMLFFKNCSSPRSPALSHTIADAFHSLMVWTHLARLGPYSNTRT